MPWLRITSTRSASPLQIIEHLYSSQVVAKKLKIQTTFKQTIIPFGHFWFINYFTVFPARCIHKCGLCRRVVFVCLSRSCIVSKQLKIRPLLLWNTNRISYTSFRVVPFSVTLSDLEWLGKIFNDMKHRASSLRQMSCLLNLISRGYYYDAIQLVVVGLCWSHLTVTPLTTRESAKVVVKRGTAPAQNSKRHRHPHRRNSTVADDRQCNWPSWTAYSQSAQSRSVVLLFPVLHCDVWYTNQRRSFLDKCFLAPLLFYTVVEGFGRYVI